MQTELNKYQIAMLLFPALSRFTASSEKVLNVVNPPQKPVAQRSHSGCVLVQPFCVAIPASTPMIRLPIALTNQVPRGKAILNACCTAYAEMLYRAILPSAPPKPTNRNCCILISFLSLRQMRAPHFSQNIRRCRSCKERKLKTYTTGSAKYPRYSLSCSNTSSV